MPPSFSLKTPQALALWYLWWTILIPTLPLPLKVPGTQLQFVLRWQLGWKPSTNTTTRLTIPRCIGLQWVRFLPQVIFIDYVPVLHSCHKLHYFKMAGWEDTWIKTAHTIVCNEFNWTYAFIDVEEAESHRDSNKIWEEQDMCVIILM